jgi:subtilase family serine protease
MHPKATAENDRGLADASMELPAVTLVRQPSAAQQADLEQLIADQQDPQSDSYHAWLTPEQYADRFGLSQDDMLEIADWLRGRSLQVARQARARNAITVSGTAAAVGAGFF